ncbi:MAG: transglycosylase SLT domain-containing protein [Chitinophagales bacterium]|jgi:membrane-bound lytic murein transglycosylase D|nr:transglycosylase SLT domain-containing protein [Chitinophagales bacterium]HNI43191.1 transglycosylase SLT domain-containing protein [Chitinophagales bacterium]HNL07108.1 transglycosylase SLT domain-containing protein [Chitinophagales bacterium]
MESFTYRLLFGVVILLGISSTVSAQYDESVLELLADLDNFSETTMLLSNESATATISSTSSSSSFNAPTSSDYLNIISNPISAYSDREYEYKLSLLHSAVPLQYNALVRSYIDAFTVHRRSAARDILSYSTIYFPIFERALAENGVPTELKYLAIPESALVNHRYSTAGAAGLWQLMPVTARQYGLVVNDVIDERLDPQKSAQVAAKCLKASYNKYNNWLLAIAAYNCGNTVVDQAIKKAGGNTNFWAISDFLPRQTRAYVPQYIAATYWMNYYFDHNIVFSKPTDMPAYNSTDLLEVKGGLSLEAVSKHINVDANTLIALNPALKKGVVPNDQTYYQLRLPVTEIWTFKQHETSIYTTLVTEKSTTNTIVDKKTANNNKEQLAVLTYTVKKGDNLGTIATWYDCNSSDIKAWNKISGNVITVGQELKIYLKKSVSHYYRYINSNSFAQNEKYFGDDKTPIAAANSKNTASSGKVAAAKNTFQQYTVKPGDSLWSITQKFPANTVKSLQQLNGLKTTEPIAPGQKIKIKVG